MKKGFWKPSEWLCFGTWRILKEHLDIQTGSALGNLKGTLRALKELLDFQPLEVIQGHLGTWLPKALRCSCVRNVHGTWILETLEAIYFSDWPNTACMEMYDIMKQRLDPHIFSERYMFFYELTQYHSLVLTGPATFG